jgi:hypothetical protein
MIQNFKLDALSRKKFGTIFNDGFGYQCTGTLFDKRRYQTASRLMGDL